ncbi:MAG: hypoxanthine phosphoribosyltransferase [Candidatus Neomarinimicrobiota bacterium]|nr:hypoxanthine phosphoribosyltransferase [Candidatus Neomarinimicrobiota bacterium]MED5265747.1 hypoxanthine phosphoribosyltransferase [Candidatus Neomarinimicrobiota bacterium]|tara:strand:+ start:699 stop:1226 length:528 start_codon:yes stop_codon:yes gene_type:complete
MRINNKKLIKIIDEVSIQKRVKEIAIELTSKFKDKKPIFIGVLNGSFIFISDLVRNLNINCEIDFIKVSSYKGQDTTGTVKLLKDISADITNRDVVIVEDIIDSGLTIEFLVKRLKGASPKSISIVTLLLKPDIARLSLPIDIIGFEIAPDFVVGYGLDYDQDLRHLPEIYRLDK